MAAHLMARLNAEKLKKSKGALMKVVRTAAIVIGAVAAVATGVGAIVGAKAFLLATGVSLATVGAVGTLAGLVAGLTASRPSGSVQGSQTQVSFDPQAGIPYIAGRTGFAGVARHQDTYGAKNIFLGTVLVFSGCGPVQEFESFSVDRGAVTFSAGAATGDYAGWMWLDTQLGATPEASALTASQGTLPGWGAANKLSGYCAALWELKFDKNGKKFAAGVPLPMAVIKGVKVYDPRLDSTYPGGSGTHRSDDESTWEYSENPWLHALAWALGRHQNGKRVMGVGMPADSIDVAAYVEAANIADTNGWTCGGVVSSQDDKWNVLKLMCQAGGGQPMRLGGMLSCHYETSRVSLATITDADLIGKASVTATQPRRDRINTAVPRCRLETHGWEVTSLEAVSVASYVTEDGDTRTREVDFPLVQDKDQAAQLAAYEIVNAREFGPIRLTLKTKWLGYKPGDCLTLDIEELGLASQTAIITGRTLDPSTGAVTLELKSETASKHAFALGLTGTAPPTPSLDPPDYDTLVEDFEPNQLSRLSNTTGQATDTFTANDGNPFSRIVASGEARDGDVVSFPTTLSKVPQISFLPGGNAATAGENVAIQAVGLSTTGFTMKAKSQAVTAGSTITDTGSAAGGTGEPDLVINRTDGGAPFDGKFTFRFTVTVGEIAPGEPGNVDIGIFVKQSAAWVQVGSATRTATGTYDYSVTPGTVDFGAGTEFGVSLLYSEGTGSALSGFTHVKYTLGTVTETSLTPAGASPIPWLALLS